MTKKHACMLSLPTLVIALYLALSVAPTQPDITIQEHHGPEGTALIFIIPKTGNVAAWILFCPYTQQIRSSLADLGPCDSSILFISDLYIAQPYRKKGFTKTVFDATIAFAQRNNYTKLVWIADPYDIHESPDGRFEEYQEIHNLQQHAKQLKKLVQLYVNIGAQPRRNTDGNYLVITAPRSGKPGIPFILNVIDYIPPVCSH